VKRSLSSRIERLEGSSRFSDPGERVAEAFFRKLQLTLGHWVWRWEARRPDRFRKDYKGYTTPGSDERRAAMRAWRSARAESWKSREWTLKIRYNADDIRVQEGDDPDVPEEWQTRRLYGEIVACITPIMFNWCKDRLWRDVQKVRAGITLPYAWEDVFAIELLFAESRARYWRGRLGPGKLEDITFPYWAMRDRQKMSSEDLPLVKR
jgi:hypothetical protein